MTEQPKRRGVLMVLAAEGMIPVVGGCAGALAGGPEGGVVGGMMGVAVGQAVEKVINFFGARIVHRWGEWFRHQPPEVRQEALAELATLPAEEARQQASALLDQLVLEKISPADREVALSYLSLLPGALDRALPRDIGTGVRSLPPTMSLEEPAQLLGLLPVSLPPYPIGTEVPGTPYRLDSLLGSGGFGAVYRASTRSLQHLPLAIKFCLDPALTQSLQRERANLERLMKAGGQDWSPRVVRLYGYDLEHRTPYLVYEYVTGGDLIRHVAEQREKLGRALSPSEVLELVTQVAESLAFAHQHGLVHRDLKPANVLVESGVLKLADFGLGGVTATRAAQVSRIGATTVDTLSAADQASLFRGAGTPLYMAPEQRRGQPPDPRHDLYSLGVMWYQLLVGDVSRELHPGWAKELSLRFGVPKSQISLIDCCVGWYDERPKHAGELLRMIREAKLEPATAAPPVENPAAAPAAPTMRTPAALTQPADELRRGLLQSLVKRLFEGHDKVRRAQSWAHVVWPAVVGAMLGGGLAAETRAGPMPGLIPFFAAIGASVGWYARFWRRGTAELQVTESIRSLQQEFPDQVRDWGGEAVLRNPDVVAQLAQRLGVVEPPATADAQLPPLDSAAKKAVGARLTQLNEKVTHAAGFAERRPFPLVLAILCALALGTPAGILSGFAYSSYYGPFGTYGLNYRQEWYTSAGMLIDHAQYQGLMRRMTPIAAIVGVGVGLAVAVLVGLLLTRFRWYRLQTLFALLLGAVVAVPAGIGMGFLHDHLFGPYWLYAANYQKTYYNAKGDLILLPDFQSQQNKSVVISALIGVGVGLVLLAGAQLLFQMWYHRRSIHVRMEAGDEVRKFASDFPQVVASCGGSEAIKDPANVEELLRKLG